MSNINNIFIIITGIELSTNKRKNLIDLTNSKGNLIILKDF